MSSVLVTGAGGTLGRPLVKALRDAGHTVLGADLMHGMTDRRCDVRNYRQVEALFDERRFDYVFHLAAEFGRINGDEFYEQCWTTNCVGTANVIELCRLFATRLVFASSSEIYGELGKPTQAEQDDRLPLRPGNDYAISKWANELQIIHAEQAYGLEALRLRFFNAYGPGEHFHPYRSVVCLFCHAALHDEPLTVFQGYHRTFMYVDDFIPTVAGVADADWDTLRGKRINVGGTDYRSVEELAEIVLATVPGSASQIELLPEDEHNVVNKQSSTELARDLLGHDPQTRIEEGVPLYIEWLMQQQISEVAVG